MDITNQYVLFHPNYIASKREQIKLEKLIKLSKEVLKGHSNRNNNLKIWRVENKEIKKYVPQESKYNFKQIVKNFKLNREQILNGYSNKYINLFTDLLYENDLKNYPQKRLILVDFRKKILRKKKKTSFEKYIEKQPFTERYDFSKQKMTNFYLTTVIQKHDKEIIKKKISCLTSRNEQIDKSKYGSNRSLLKLLSTDINSNDNKYKLKLSPDNNNSIKKLFSYNDNNIKNSYNNENINKNNLYGNKLCNSSFSESNILYNDNHNTKKVINDYTSRKDEEENKYYGKLSAKEEYIEGRNKAKYIDYLKKKYNFYNINNKDLKNYSEIKRRQIKFSSGKDKIEYPIEYPYKKEFIKRFNRLNSRRKIKYLIKENIKNNDISINYLKAKKKLIKY